MTAPTHAVAENTRLVVAGRTFGPVTPTTLRHFQYLTGHLLAAEAFGPGTVGQKAACVTDAGRGPQVLAGLYVEVKPDGEPASWSVESARLVAAAFAEVTEPDVWAAMTLALLDGLNRFFVPAPVSSTSSPGSSTGSTPESGAPAESPETPNGGPS